MEPGARSRKSPSALVAFHLDNKIRELMSAIEHELVWHASRNPDNISGRKFLTGATLNGAVALLMRRDWSEEDFRRQLSNARITRLSGPKGAKGAAIEFVEGAKNRRVVAACSRRRTAGGDSGRLKGGPIEPADAVYSGTACV